MNTYIDPKLLLSQASQAAISNKQGNGNKNPEQLKKLCQQFEAILLNTMFKGMRSTVPDSGLIEKGPDAEIYQELRDQSVAEQMARHQSIGLAETLFGQLKIEEE